MQTINDSSDQNDAHPLSRFVAVERHEVPALIYSFFMFFMLLAAYYVVRPVRDEMGVAVGKDAIHRLFTIVFFVMLAAVPAFGWAASRFPRRRVLPGFYAFFAVNLIAFWVLLRFLSAGPAMAGAFFIWASVFNLFVVSLFWSLMSELWTTTEAKRLYGFIAAGGTAGALAGPLLAQGLLSVFKPVDLLLVSAVLLTAGLFISLALRNVRSGQLAVDGDSEVAPAGGGILEGAVKVFTEPFFARIAIFVLLANVVGTFFYMEQSRLVGDVIADSTERVRFFASRDLAVSVLTLSIEIVGTAYILNRLGVGFALIALPLMATVGVFALSSHTVLWVVAAVMVGERVIAFSVSGPAIKLMYTLATPGEKYKVQSFVDTVVYRGGDAASGWIFALLGAGAGFGGGALPALALGLTGLWMWNAKALSKSYNERVQSAPAPSS